MSERIRVAYRLIEVEDFFISNHNRGKLVDEDNYLEYIEAKQIYKAALNKFKEKYENK